MQTLSQKQEGKSCFVRFIFYHGGPESASEQIWSLVVFCSRISSTRRVLSACVKQTSTPVRFRHFLFLSVWIWCSSSFQHFITINQTSLLHKLFHNCLENLEHFGRNVFSLDSKAQDKTTLPYKDIKLLEGSSHKHLENRHTDQRQAQRLHQLLPLFRSFQLNLSLFNIKQKDLHFRTHRRHVNEKNKVSK